MKTKIVALAGLSGVGKSTLLAAAAKQLKFQHLQASALIKKGREANVGQAVLQDRLRYFDLDENQQLLVRGLDASVDPKIGLAVLDSHTLIERDADHFVVKPSVFRAVGIAAMIFLREEPLEIARRRANDHSRVRPKKDASALSRVQSAATDQARLICRQLGVPLHIKPPSNIDGVVRLLRVYAVNDGA